MIEVYFKDLQRIVIGELSKALKSVKIAMAWMDLNIYEKTLKKLSLKGIKIEILLDENDKNLGQKELIDNMIDNNITVDYIEKHNKINTMHHKFCIIDDKKVLTGSYNWTNNAHYNFENLLVLVDELTVKKFCYEFDEILLFKNYMRLVNRYDKITRLLYEKPDVSHGGTEENNIYIIEIDELGNPTSTLFDTTGSMVTSVHNNNEDIDNALHNAKTDEEVEQLNICKEILKLDRMLELQKIVLSYSINKNKLIDAVLTRSLDEELSTIYKPIWKNRFSKNIQDKYYGYDIDL